MILWFSESPILFASAPSPFLADVRGAPPVFVCWRTCALKQFDAVTEGIAAMFPYPTVKRNVIPNRQSQLPDSIQDRLQVPDRKSDVPWRGRVRLLGQDEVYLNTTDFIPSPRLRQF